MRRLLLLFAALLVASCGEKSPSEDSDSTGESAEASPEAVQQSEEPLTLPLSDADVERLLKEAVELEQRGRLVYKNNEPYSGWVKMMYDSGQVFRLVKVKDGKRNGPIVEWHENGQKQMEGNYKHNNPDGFGVRWHENGQKKFEGTFKDGKQYGLHVGWHENGQKHYEGNWKNDIRDKDTERWWNSKGEEVETVEESNN